MHVFICGSHRSTLSAAPQETAILFLETISFTGTSLVLGCLATELSASASPVTDGTTPQATCLASPPEFCVGSREQT